MEEKKSVKKPGKTRPSRPAAAQTLSATERCRAVLSVWTERRRPAQVCRELDIQVAVLTHWQQRALEGMLQALEPRTQLATGAALSPRLQAMLEKKQKTQEKRQVRALQLENRLNAIQRNRTPEPATPKA